VNVFRVDRSYTGKLKGMKGLQPLKDEVLLYLWEQALSGQINVYFAAVPFNLIIPFDKEYDPRKNPVGRAAVNQAMEEWSEGKIQDVWLYPKQNNYVLSDDYITYFAAVEGEPDYLPAFIFGEVINPAVIDIQGPIPKEELAKITFGTES
jgi:hypothetical protein